MRIAPGLLASLLLALPASAGTPRLADPGYLARPARAQAEPPKGSRDVIVVPTASTPVLCAWGESFEVQVLLPPGAEPGQVGDWLAALSTGTRGPWGDRVGQPVSMRFVLGVKSVTHGPEGTALLTLGVPAQAPRDVYHLELAGPSGIRAHRVYAVRVLGDAERRKRFRFVLIGDSQLRDPSSDFSGADLNSGSYPHRGEDAAEIMFNQQVSEIAFLDPDFVINVGDLVFGVDYREEYRQTLTRWWDRSLATFMVPGNHDGLALYELALRDGWWIEAIKSVRCAKYVIDGEVSAESVFQVLACLFGDLKKMLFEDLAQDGLDYWTRLLGPLDFSFDVGRFHFAGINTYAGTPERRHAFVLGLDFIGIDLGAATVDNYGGTLTADQLSWLEADLKRARDQGQTVVLFLHHDPRGAREEPWGRAYHANLPFPTEPLGLRKFQEWNYDSAEWDSAPEDSLPAETQTSNSAIALLKLIADHVDYVFSGHIHDDETTVIEAGDELVAGSGIRARNRIHYVRVTTASSTTERSDGYWGYRLMRADQDRIEDLVYYPDFEWQSVPSGNLWVVGSGLPNSGLVGKMGGNLLFVVHSGLPRPAQGMLRAYLADAPEGYRFPANAGAVRIEDVGRGEGGRNIYYLRVEVPAVRSGKVPVPAGEEEAIRIGMERAKGNLAPRVTFAMLDEDAWPGQPLRFDGSGTTDPEGRPLIQHIWDFGDGEGARGQSVVHTYTRAGDYTVSLTAADDCGAFARYSTRVTVTPPPSCAVGSGACAATSATLVVVGLVFLGGWWLARRRRRGQA